MKQAQFITLEGTEGAGKSSVLSVITNELDKWQVPYITTREPGGEITAERIREILLYSDHLDAKTELLLMFASRNEHLVKTIRPALEAGTWVVSDRFVDASYAYQGGGRGIDEGFIDSLSEWTIEETLPDLTLYLDVTPEVGLSRAAERSAKDRIEQEDVDFFHAIRQAYVRRWQTDPDRIKRVNADLSMSAVANQIRSVLKDFKGKL